MAFRVPQPGTDSFLPSPQTGPVVHGQSPVAAWLQETLLRLPGSPGSGGAERDAGLGLQLPAQPSGLGFLLCHCRHVKVGGTVRPAAVFLLDTMPSKARVRRYQYYLSVD